MNPVSKKLIIFIVGFAIGFYFQSPIMRFIGENILGGPYYKYGHHGILSVDGECKGIKVKTHKYMRGSFYCIGKKINVQSMSPVVF